MQTKVILGRGGRVVIPAPFRKALGIKPGDELILTLEDSGVRLSTRLQAIEGAQALVRQYVPSGRNLSQELIEQRRLEQARVK